MFIRKLLPSFYKILKKIQENPQGPPLRKVVKTKLFLSTCYGNSSTPEAPLFCEAATKINNFIHIQFVYIVRTKI